MTSKSRIVFVDIETAPSLGWVWAKWETNVIDFKTDWYMLSFSYKWADEDKVHVVGLDDFPGYKSNLENDKKLAKALWDVLNEADVVVAHNGDAFDLPKANTRFISHGFKPPKPYKTVDTLKIARRAFKFDSNKLDDLGRYLGIGRKLPNTGFHLWRGCMTGDADSWKLMKEYNKQDVILLEKVYFLVRAWGNTYPVVNQGTSTCPRCGSEKVQKRGFSYTQQSKKQRYQCSSCSGWYEGHIKKQKTKKEENK
jgi:uncharacterized protein YprB with RNaseH-like and TPR domain